MNFAQIPKQLMDKNNLTNYQLAKELDCHQTSVKNWLDGATPQKLMLKKISDYFGVSIEYLLTGEQKNSAAPQAARPNPAAASRFRRYQHRSSLKV